LFAKEDMLLFDKIYAMDMEIYKDIQHISGNVWDETKVDLIMHALFPGENLDVPDPWYGNENNFREVFDMLHKACEVIVQQALSQALDSHQPPTKITRI
jgi:protein-tyrosine phosphatase